MEKYNLQYTGQEVDNLLTKINQAPDAIASESFVKSEIADLINPEKLSVKANNYEYAEKMASWGKSVGGAVALGVMLVTNFIIDAPFINKINKKTTDLINKISKKEDKSPENVQKEVK